MEELTKAEERVMHILWQIEKGFVKDIIDKMDEDPKPPYNTISSVVRILKDKGFVGFKAYGKTHEYFPTISKNAYRLHSFKRMLSSYFDNSPEALVSFLVEKKELSDQDKQDITNILNKMDETDSKA